MSITYLIGDATEPSGTDLNIIAHVVNDEGKWGAGFAKALGAKYPEAERAYRNWAAGDYTPPEFGLGRVQLVYVGGSTVVANIVAQRGVRSYDNPVPVVYRALRVGLAFLAGYCLGIGDQRGYKPSVHMPRIGCGLAGGEWSVVEGEIERTLGESRIPTIVYTLASETGKFPPAHYATEFELAEARL
jgi:O-acetyl-ADP-ribose deacetylase (regulator of RNase III)